jgi:O-antigen ligase
MTLGRRSSSPWLAALLCCALVAEGFAVSRSYLLAAPLLALVAIAVAVELPVVPVLGGLLLVRVLSDDMSAEGSRQAAAFSPTALIGALLILLAAAWLLERRRGLGAFTAIAGAIAVWTLTATLAEGSTAVTVREGVRELSIVAVAAIALCAPRLSMATAVRLVQIAGAVAALVALQQLATGGGVLIAGELRANGTFAHPNGAAVYFAIAAACSVWRYVDAGRAKLDLAFAAAFSAATLATFSIAGFGSLLAMLVAFGLMRPGSALVKRRAALLVVVLAAAFVLSPVGSQRLAGEANSETTLNVKGEAESSSLVWRLDKWGSLLPEWERNPIFGSGLGTTTTAETTRSNTSVGSLPHNEYVRYLVETGALGMAALIAALVLLIRRLDRRRHLPGTDGAAAVLGLAVVIGLMFDGLAANTLLYTPAAFAAALVVATALRRPQPEPAPPPPPREEGAAELPRQPIPVGVT